MLLENTVIQSEIPPQLTENLQQKVASYLQGGRLSITESTRVNIFLGFLVQFFWGQLEDFSFLTINSMISIMIPGIPSLIQSVLLKFIYFDILYTELWMMEFMKKIGINFDYVEDDQALNFIFSDNNFQSMQFLKNAGSSTIYVIMYFFAWIVFMMIYLLSMCWSKLIIAKEKL